jgi:PPP family 3-phenylpropionic acid transporter
MFPSLPRLLFGFSARVAALYAAIFMLGGIQLPFLPVWLRAKGLDAATIGLVLATPMVVRVLAIPFAARAATGATPCARA